VLATTRLVGGEVDAVVIVFAGWLMHARSQALFFSRPEVLLNAWGNASLAPIDLSTSSHLASLLATL